MKRVLDVFLGNNSCQVGTLRFEARGARQNACFEYHPDWLASGQRFALEPGLPLVSGMQFHQPGRDGSIFHGAIADTEPDGWGRKVIQRDHAKQRQHARELGTDFDSRALNHLDFLLAVDDASRVGALRFRDEHQQFLRIANKPGRSTPPLIELDLLRLATRAVELHAETAADLAFLRGRGTTLGGLRPKCTVVDESGRLSIGKFPSVHDDRPVTKGEVLALKLARDSGIDAAEARLVDSDGTQVALIRRFDRMDDGQRIMFVSAATMIGADSQDGTEHTYTELVDALRQFGLRPQADIEELWRRIAFSILITNVDDHLHNHGFLHSHRGLWTLAPAFDVNPFPDRARELKTWISEQSGPDASIDALMSVAAYFRIRKERAVQILKDVEHATARWREVGQSLGMSKRELDQFEEAFEHRERDAARKLFGS
ncbi:MAG: type II toxin-antitoxin system HipA family toxin [Ahniella sp.]|nr:type II toxin-antitoxin system HipA family toxin [Ahniella sp.]